MPDPSNPPDAAGGNGSATPPKSVLAYNRALPTERRTRIRRSARAWARTSFSRDRFAGLFRTLLWITPLTVLIWVYAEREELHPQPDVTIPIEVTTNDPGHIVTLQRPSDPFVIATLSGPKAQVESVMHNLDPRYGGSPVQIVVDRNLGVGDRRIDASRIGNDARFVSHGVTVSGCQPAWLEVYVDPIEDVSVDVKAVGLPSNVASVEFSPPALRVRGPRRVLENAKEGGRLVLNANLAGRPELTNAVAEPSSRTIPLPDVKVMLPFDSRYVSVVDAPVVRANASLRSGKELVLPYVPVAVVATNDVLDHYRVDYENNKTLPNVTVVGPENEIEMLSNPDFTPRPRATFDVTVDDVGGPRTRQVEFKLPPGVTYKGGPREVTFTLVPRRNGE